MDSKATVSVGSESVEIDPQLLFQRLITAGTNSGDLDNVFRYELCSYPPAIFKHTNIMLEADKPTLADALWKDMPDKDDKVPKNVHYALDGGSLLHRAPFETGQTWEKTFSRFTFDGYQSGPTTKDGAHAR